MSPFAYSRATDATQAIADLTEMASTPAEAVRRLRDDPSYVEQFRAALKQAGKSAAVHVYPDSPSCFLDPDSPYHEGRSDAKVIADAWRRIDDHLAKALKP